MAASGFGCVWKGGEKEEEEGEVTVAVVEDKGYEHESGGEKGKSVCDFIAIRGQMNQKMRFSPTRSLYEVGRAEGSGDHNLKIIGLPLLYSGSRVFPVALPAKSDKNFREA